MSGFTGPLDLPVRPLAWMDWGSCQESDPELWFPEKGGSTGPAKRICADCPVQAECLEMALEDPARFYGIWGGTSERERRVLRAQRDRKAA